MASSAHNNKNNHHRSSTRKEVAKTEHCTYCFDSLICHFEQKSVPKPSFQNSQYPLFVSWHKLHSSTKKASLRGCKGTFSSLFIHEGLKEYALISALKDTRFSPIIASEVPQLECSVSLLFDFEQCDDAYDWEIGVHGIILDFYDPKRGKQRSATYLPQIASEQGWTQDETLESLAEKAGYVGRVTDQLIETFQVTRYQSSETKLRFKEYHHSKK